MKRLIIGIDEVGRGPLAGPVTVAAMIMPRRSLLRGIKDSKKLSANQRENWFLKLKTSAYTVSSVGSKSIDTFGISVAVRRAVGRCLKKMDIENKKVKILLDGALYAPRTYENQETIIKGDEKVPVIAAASIMAKVIRDRTMKRLHKKYPHYGFDLHKGYGTRAHQAAIRTHGLCDIHRKSFCRKLI